MTDSTFSALDSQAQALSRIAYSDIHKLRSLGNEGPEALERAAAQFESLFVDIWLKSMRDAARVFGEGSYLSSSAVEMHQEMLDHQWAVHVSEAGGVGLKEVLMRQLAGRVGETVATGKPGTSSRRGAEGANAGSPGTPGTAAGAVRGGLSPHGPGTSAASSSGDGIAEAAHGVKQALFDGAESFLKALEPLARRIAGASGIHPVAVLAQAALETGWGSKVPHDGAGNPSYNLFGIKSDGWDGASVDVTTLEHQFDRFVRKIERFRAYGGVAEAVQDYVALLTGNERYAGAMAVAQDPPAFADALQEAGYATDPGYAEKLKALQRQIATMLQSSPATPEQSRDI